MLTLNFTGVVVLLGALQGLTLVVALGKIKDRNISANRFLRLFIFLISLTLIGRIILETNLKDDFPNFFALPDGIIFIYGPAFYFYMQKLLWGERKGNSKFYAHLIPAFSFIIISIPFYLSPENLLRQSWDVYKPVIWGLAELFGLIHNVIYAALSIWLLRRYQQSSDNYFSFEQCPTYLKSILILVVTVLLFWAYSCISWISGNGNTLTSMGYNIVWFILPCITYALGYFAMYQPEVFKLPIPEVKSNRETISQEDFDSLKIKIQQVMQEEKPYLNPKLSLGQLAKLLEITPHILSRVINTSFGMKFNDFVNNYRIGEFKKISSEKKYENMTVLAMAFDAGFNSKTTFNTAFKKLTQMTPNEYLKTQKEKVI